MNQRLALGRPIFRIGSHELLDQLRVLRFNLTMGSVSAGVWVGAQVDPLAVFVGVVSELGWG